MDTLIYAILGIIQGLTEPLPISSSGHLLFFKELFNTNMFDLNFEIIVNFGSFLAILFIFRKDIIKLINSFLKYISTKEKKYKNDFNYCWMLVISSIPVGISGIIFKDTLDGLISVNLVGIALLITAVLLYLVKNNNGKKEDKDIFIKQAIIIGLFQMIAIIPGISRSGSCLVGCLLVGLNKESALKYTFLLYFPVSIAAMALGVTDFISDANTSLLLPYTIGMIASLVVTYLTYNWFSNIVKKGSLWKFSIYCIILGTFILFYFR